MPSLTDQDIIDINVEGDGESLSASEPNESNSQATSPAIVTTTHSSDISANPRAVDTSSVVNTPEVVSKSPAIITDMYSQYVGLIDLTNDDSDDSDDTDDEQLPRIIVKSQSTRYEDATKTSR